MRVFVVFAAMVWYAHSGKEADANEALYIK